MIDINHPLLLWISARPTRLGQHKRTEMPFQNPALLASTRTSYLLRHYLTLLRP